MPVESAVLFFAGELTGLLTRPHDAGRISYPVDRRASIKDVIEALGVPHTEVYSINSGGAAHGFDLPLEPRMKVAFLPANLSSWYPVDVTAPTLLRPAALDSLRFLVDENVAGLVPLLRALGFDATYDRSWDDKEISKRASGEARVVLSRDRALLKRTLITYGRLIRSQTVDEQLVEVLHHFRMNSGDTLFSRCLRCNEVTRCVQKQDVLDLLEPKTKKYFDQFRQCPSCGRVYWRGSHCEKLMERFARLGIFATPEAD